MNDVVLHIAAAVTGGWGIAHLLATRGVVEGFGEISTDNRHIITMEWIFEGVSLIFIGVLVGAVALTDSASPVADVVFFISAAALISLALVSLATGFKVRFLPFRLCPLIFSLSALLIIWGALA